MTYYTFFLF